MRQGVWAFVACVLACPASAGAQSAPAPTKSSPIVVAGVPVTVAQAKARIGRDTAPFQVRDMLADLAQARVARDRVEDDDQVGAMCTLAVARQLPDRRG